MSSKRSDSTSSHEHEKESPFNDFDLDMSASRLISKAPLHEQANLIEKIEVKPSEQRRISLGSFTKNNPPKGFSVEINPDPNPAGSVLTEITSLGTFARYKLVMHIANYGGGVVNVEVWRL